MNAIHGTTTSSSGRPTTRTVAGIPKSTPVAAAQRQSPSLWLVRTAQYSAHATTRMNSASVSTMCSRIAWVPLSMTTAAGSSPNHGGPPIRRTVAKRITPVASPNACWSRMIPDSGSMTCPTSRRNSG